MKRKDACNVKAAIPLLLVCALRYVGRGWTFDDLAENAAISEDTLRVFFHCFIDNTVRFQLMIPRELMDHICSGPAKSVLQKPSNTLPE